MDVWVLIDHGPDCATADVFTTKEFALRFVEEEVLEGKSVAANLKWEVSETNPDYQETDYQHGHLSLYKTPVIDGVRA